MSRFARRLVPDPSVSRAAALGIEITGAPQAIQRFERLLRTFSATVALPSVHG